MKRRGAVFCSYHFTSCSFFFLGFSYGPGPICGLAMFLLG